MPGDNVSELDQLVRAARAAITRIHKTPPGVPVTEIVEFAASVPSSVAVTLHCRRHPSFDGWSAWRAASRTTSWTGRLSGQSFLPLRDSARGNSAS